MRRAYLFVAALTALSTTAAAKEEVYYKITLTEARSAAKVDSFTVKQGVKAMSWTLDRAMVKSWSTSGDADAPPIGTSDLTMKRGTGPAGPTGPHNNGRLIIVTTATGDCTVGKRYATATLVGGGKSYKLGDATITDCGWNASGVGGVVPGVSVTISYKKLEIVPSRLPEEEEKKPGQH